MVFVGLVGLVACGGGDDPAIVESGGLAVLDAWVRPTPPTVSDAAFYVTIENRDAPDDRLIGAGSDACTLVTPHVTEISDDVASMDEAGDDQLGLRSGESVVMSPNGLHLMCLGLVRPLAAGDEVEVELRFAEHAPIAVPLVVEQR